MANILRLITINDQCVLIFLNIVNGSLRPIVTGVYSDFLAIDGRLLAQS
jgi:hypothetical protein